MIYIASIAALCVAAYGLFWSTIALEAAARYRVAVALGSVSVGFTAVYSLIAHLTLPLCVGIDALRHMTLQMLGS